MVPMSKPSLAPSVTSRNTKGRKFMDIVGAAYDKEELSDEEAQRVNEFPGLADLISKFIADNRRSNKFKDEEVMSSRIYPNGYAGPKPIKQQVEILLKHFPGLDPEPAFRYMRDIYPKLNLPNWVEGAFAVPNEYVLAEKFYPQVKGRLPRYCAGVNLVLEKIAQTGRPFYNYCEGQVRRILRTTQMIDRLIEMQGGADIIIHPMQLGIRHAGRSVRRGRELYAKQEFGEGSLEVGSVVLTHPERLSCWEELDMDCAGDEFRPHAGDDFSHAPCFDFDDGKAGFGASVVSDVLDDFGAVSAFLQECPES